jgi:hypothetical protein
MRDTNVTKHKKGVYHTGMKLSTNLPPTIKHLNHIRLFKPALKEYLLPHSSYSVKRFTRIEYSQL